VGCVDTAAKRSLLFKALDTIKAFCGCSLEASPNDDVVSNDSIRASYPNHSSSKSTRLAPLRASEVAIKRAPDGGASFCVGLSALAAHPHGSPCRLGYCCCYCGRFGGWAAVVVVVDYVWRVSGGSVWEVRGL
jgi:hypothetical protein